jgi:two-component system cell cycle sensor histidine kinase PleC
MGGRRDRLVLVRSAAVVLAVGVTILVAVIPVSNLDGMESANIAIRYALPLMPIWLVTLLVFLIRDDRDARRDSPERTRESDAAEHRLLDAIESVPAGIVLYDADERFVICNAMYREIRRDVEDLLVPGASFEDILHASAERRLGVLEGVDESNVGEWIEQRLRWFRDSGQPEEQRFRDGHWEEIQCFRTQAGGHLIIRADITARKEAEEASALSRDAEAHKSLEFALGNEGEAAEFARREKSRFLANTSHEFRTPLNAILGFADVLKQQYFGSLGDERYQEYVNYICTSGEHQLALVNDLLDLSVIEAGKQALQCENLAADDIVADSVRIFSVRADIAAVQLEISIPEYVPPIYADRRLVKQVLLNLLSNAVKFTPEGGKVTISADVENGFTELRVADTGRGIPGDKLAEVTSPFQKGEGDPYLAAKGWGLGLAISKSIVELHNGKLEIESQVGAGTSVSVKLPSVAN